MNFTYIKPINWASPSIESKVQWASYNQKINSIEKTGETSIGSLTLSKNIILIIPFDQLSWIETDIPNKRKFTKDSFARNIIEDFCLSKTDSVHLTPISHGSRIRGYALTNEKHLDGWIQILRQIHKDISIEINADISPDRENNIYICNSKNINYIVLQKNSSANFIPVEKIHIQETIAKLKSSVDQKKINVFIEPTSLNDLSESGFETDEFIVKTSYERWIETDSKKISFNHGKLKRNNLIDIIDYTKKITINIIYTNEWRYFRVGLFFLSLIFLTHHAMKFNRALQNQKNIDHELVTIFKDNFPDQKVIYEPVLQAKKILETEIQNKNINPNRKATQYLAEIGNGISSPNEVTKILFVDNQMLVKIKTQTEESANQIKTRVSSTHSGPISSEYKDGNLILKTMIDE